MDELTEISLCFRLAAFITVAEQLILVEAPH